MRAARRVSESGYYHVILRGDGKRRIFEDDDDRREFLKLLSEQVVNRGVDIIAWCLMDNHVHLVVQDSSSCLSIAIGSLAMRYAQRFNMRTGHVGHVFQERFKSSPIESDAYLLEAVRYVHNNPEKSGICRAEEYPWSSYSEYVTSSWITDTETVLDMLGGVEGFKEFCAAVPALSYRFSGRVRIADDEMGEMARSVLGDVSVYDVKALPVEERNERLRALRECGLSVRQVERLTGIGAKTITRATT
ncbi:MAG TPA: transposase [Candidatus Olsenella avicola]|nr:transposase [Candidatus Olsenella avicola]